MLLDILSFILRGHVFCGNELGTLLLRGVIFPGRVRSVVEDLNCDCFYCGNVCMSQVNFDFT